MSEPEIRKMYTLVLATDEQIAQARDAVAFQEALHRALTNPGPPLPPPPDPGPHPAYVTLLEAARVSSPVLVELVELHEPKPGMVCQDGTVARWDCHGEQPNGYDWEWPDWPCETVAVVSNHLGVEVR